MKGIDFMEIKKIKAGLYVTSDGNYTIEKDGCFWYAYDTETGSSVVDSEDSFRLIKQSLLSYLKSAY